MLIFFYTCSIKIGIQCRFNNGLKSSIQYWVADIISLLYRHRFQVCNSILGCRHLSVTESTPVSGLQSATEDPIQERHRSNVGFPVLNSDTGPTSFIQPERHRSYVGSSVQDCRPETGALKRQKTQELNSEFESEILSALLAPELHLQFSARGKQDRGCKQIHSREQHHLNAWKVYLRTFYLFIDTW